MNYLKHFKKYAFGGLVTTPLFSAVLIGNFGDLPVIDLPIVNYAEPLTIYKSEKPSTDRGWDLSSNILYKSLSIVPKKKESDLHEDLSGLLKLFDKYGLKVKVTSGKREGAKTSSGRTSYHAYGRAIDIVPENGDFVALAIKIKQTPEISNYMRSKGLGVLDETSKEMLAKTGGTGKHFHIGPDKIAQEFWSIA